MNEYLDKGAKMGKKVLDLLDLARFAADGNNTEAAIHLMAALMLLTVDHPDVADKVKGVNRMIQVVYSLAKQAHGSVEAAVREEVKEYQDNQPEGNLKS